MLICCWCFLLAAGRFAMTGPLLAGAEEEPAAVNPHCLTRSACLEGRRPSVPSDLDRIRGLLEQRSLRDVHMGAFLIPSEDHHQMQSLDECDARLRYLTGFSGGLGLAVVSPDHALFWTTGRHAALADLELPCEWTICVSPTTGSYFSRQSVEITPWLEKNLEKGFRIGADPFLFDHQTWMRWKEHLGERDFGLIPLNFHPVDKIWEDRPPCSSNAIYPLDLKYTGENWEKKIQKLRRYMERHKVDVVVLSAPDEIAWLLNLRGYDSVRLPLFRGYVIAERNRTTLFVDLEKVTDEVRRYLDADSCLAEGSVSCVRIQAYGRVLKYLDDNEVYWRRILLPGKQHLHGGTSFAFYSSVREVAQREVTPRLFQVRSKEKVVVHRSPVAHMMSIKNPKELQGMQRASVKDAVAFCDFMAALENSISGGAAWSHQDAVGELKTRLAVQEDFMGFSVNPQSASGNASAVPGRSPDRLPVDGGSLYLLDFGAQYKDGTTRVSRVAAFGRPEPLQAEMYTRVLMGLIDLANLTFPLQTLDRELDQVARRHLHEAGSNFPHATAHGMGTFLTPEEGSLLVEANGGKGTPLEENQVLLAEPAYYDQPAGFGIRLGSTLKVVKVTEVLCFPSLPSPLPLQKAKDFLGFEMLTLVPFDHRLLQVELMTWAQTRWLNQHNARIRMQVGQELKRQGKTRAFSWMMSRTGHVYRNCNGANLADRKTTSLLLLLLLPAFLATAGFPP